MVKHARAWLSIPYIVVTVVKRTRFECAHVLRHPNPNTALTWLTIPISISIKAQESWRIKTFNSKISSWGICRFKTFLYLSQYSISNNNNLLEPCQYLFKGYNPFIHLPTVYPSQGDWVNIFTILHYNNI